MTIRWLPRSSSRIRLPSFRVSRLLISAPATAPVKNGPSENADLRTRAGQAAGELPGQRRSRDEQQTALHPVHAAAGRPRSEVGACTLGRAARGRHAEDLVQFRDKLDLDPHDGQRLRRYLRGERREHRKRGPGARGTADGRRRPRRPVDQHVGDRLVGQAGELRAQRGLVANAQPRPHRHRLPGQPAHAGRQATAGRAGSPAGAAAGSGRPLARALRAAARRGCRAAPGGGRGGRHRGRGPVRDRAEPSGQPPGVRRPAGLRQFDGDLGRLPRGGVIRPRRRRHP